MADGRYSKRNRTIKRHTAKMSFRTSLPCHVSSILVVLIWTSPQCNGYIFFKRLCCDLQAMALLVQWSASLRSVIAVYMYLSPAYSFRSCLCVRYFASSSICSRSDWLWSIQLLNCWTLLQFGIMMQLLLELMFGSVYLPPCKNVLVWNYTLLNLFTTNVTAYSTIIECLEIWGTPANSALLR
jgi:hypothetical protein